ncbi:hypothetical protein PX699_13610 [Sphingobium sp. H39-3-25]|uniref:hypothetical protein n=1 Tax=Sphingobium arseniciresistens TaxID=3030834 RepID=UPI0023B89297|nr:hypothetical protein [Sphingobium arseniciresistens]
MFSLISLYFAYRRDVVLAERYVSGLSNDASQKTVAAPAPVLTNLPVEEIALARAA